MTDLEHRAPVRTADHALALTRDDLVASMQAYRAGAGGRQMWLPAVGVFAGLGLGAILTFLADAFTWPLVLSPIFFVGGWAVSLISLAIVFRRTRRLTDRWQWNCLHCDAPLIAGHASNPLARAEIAVATGRCPSCGQHLFEDIANDRLADRSE